MSIRAISLIVAEPSVVAARLAAAFGWTVSQDYGAFAEVTTGSVLLWLNEPSEPTTELQQGVIVHEYVDDVRVAAERARAAGATILREPRVMDFGLESAWARVDDGPVVDLTRDVTG